MSSPALSRESLDALRSEGDVNLSPRRREWSADHIGAAAQATLAEDARHFLHQSLSTPCLNVLAPRRRARGLKMWKADAT